VRTNRTGRTAVLEGCAHGDGVPWRAGQRPAVRSLRVVFGAKRDAIACLIPRQVVTVLFRERTGPGAFS
jgi:hypothetical protein